jgi:hypothetical protein
MRNLGLFKAKPATHSFNLYDYPKTEFPPSCPVAGMLNGLLFPEDPADANVLGGAKFLVTNDPRHALQTEFLQRTMPYFFRPIADEE